MTWPNSWKYVSTSSCCSSDGASAVGLLKLATMAATDIWRVPSGSRQPGWRPKQAAWPYFPSLHKTEDSSHTYSFTGQKPATPLRPAEPSPGVQVQVELADHLTTAAVLHTVQLDVWVPDGGSVHQLEGQTEELLVDVQQPLSHHLHWKILLQQVLIHSVLSLLHLGGGGG